MKRYFLLLILAMFCATDFKAQNVAKVHLFEHFTSTSCPTCGDRNPVFYSEVLEPYTQEVLHIAFHNHLPLRIDPFYQANIPENRARSNYYGIRASPSLVLNGKVLSPARPLIKGSEVAAILNETSPLQLEVNHFKNDGNFNVEIKTTLFENLPEADYKLYVAVVEKEILFCTYFEYVFDNVFRAFVEEGNGVDFNLEDVGTTASYNKKIAINEDWEYPMLYAVAYVQNEETKEIVNASASLIEDKGETNRFSNTAFKLTSRVYNSQCGAPTGSILLGVCVDASPIEAPEEVTYKWSNGDTTQNLVNVPTGMYTVEISDNKHQTKIEQTFEIKPSEKIEIEEVVSAANPANLNGVINIIANGGNGQLEIEWNDGDTNFNRNNLSKGIYSYLITDEEGCQIENTISINRSFTANDFSVNAENVSCNGKQDGNIAINLINSTEGDVILFFKDENLIPNPNQLSAGTYNYRIIDSFNDVLLEDTIVITEPEILETEILVNNENQLVASALGGTPPYTFLWNDGTTTSNIETPITNNYSVTITDTNGCLQTTNLTFTNVQLYEAQNEKVEVFPNPIKNGGFLSIKISYPINKIKLYKVDGSLVNNELYKLKENKLQLQQLTAGIYILEVILLDGVGEYAKLLVE